MPKRLSEFQQRQYFDDGLAFPIPVLSAEEVRRFRAASDELESRLGGKPRTVEVRQMHLHFPWAYELAVHPRVLDAVEDVLGPDLLIWATELFAKHPHDEAVSIGWHQDRPYMGFEAGATTSAWIALADSVPANGCMRAVPGPSRHRVEPLELEGGPLLHKKRSPTAVKVNEDEALDVVLHAGEMSLHDIDIVHGSGPNPSAHKRIGFVVRYVTPQAQPLEGRPPALLARGDDPWGHFQLVDPPRESDAEEALRRMRDSAAEHLEAMLHNLALVRKT
jgi:ectoine hydroxylase-related dioxygenase (phytanoyl-CoA dioxygenase family)